MSGRGRTPKDPSTRRGRETPQRGEWKATPGVGWQHGPVPRAPAGLLGASRTAWRTWMRSWFAAHWTPDDLPGLVVVIALYDQVQRAFEEPFVESEEPRGDTVYVKRVKRPNPVTELRQMLDNYGISPKGQQDRRWAAPKAGESPATPNATPAASRYGHLRAVGPG